MRWELAKEWRRALVKMAQKSTVIQLLSGKTETFSENAPLHLYAREFDEFAAIHRGEEPPEPTTPQIAEGAKLKEALENATPESRAYYEFKNAQLLQASDALKKSVEKTEEGAEE